MPHLVACTYRSIFVGHGALPPGTDSHEWPFSYLVEQGNAYYVLPGITLRGVGTLRDIGKWPARDRRSPRVPQTDTVSFDAFSLIRWNGYGRPYTPWKD